MDFKDFYALAYSLGTIRSIKAEPLCKQTGLNITSLNILEYLSICGHLNTANELTKMCGVKNAAFSIIISKLEKEGFVVQKTDVTDRRKKHILLTKKAEAITEQLKEISQETKTELSCCFTEEEKEMLQNSILKLTSAVLQLKNSLLNNKKSVKQNAGESVHCEDQKKEEGKNCDGGGYDVNFTNDTYSADSNG
ncbi:MAG: MarR family transcriptional regulator [Treponemataceae bacterium]|nr:MarR family transcriptional regulator [Treponemataceae bacterium]